MGATYFIQICPTCGRRLEINIEYIRQEVSCYHCRARFIAENFHIQPFHGMPGFSMMALSKNEGSMSYGVSPSTGVVSSFS